VITLIWQFIKAHPQRTTGLLLVAVGAVQANLAMFQQYVSPLVFAGLTSGLGVVVAVLGYIKSNTPPDTTDEAGV
jgi:hypothetical protein